MVHYLTNRRRKMPQMHWVRYERLLRAIFPQKMPWSDLPVYSFVVEGGNVVLLQQTLEEALDGLKHTKGRSDDAPWPRIRSAVELRFGLNGPAPASFPAIGKKLGVTDRGARYLVRNALFQIKRNHGKRLERFFAPSPWALVEMEQKIKNLTAVNAELKRQLRDGPPPIEADDPDAKRLQDAISEVENSLHDRGMQTRTLTGLRRILVENGVNTYSALKELQTKEILKVRGIGEVNENLCREILRIAEAQEASS